MAEPAAAATNGYDPEVVERFVARLESLHGALDAERDQCTKSCQVIRDDIKDVLQAAADEEGIPKKALKAIIKERQLYAKIDALVLGLEADEAAFQNLKAALGELGDTPLGQHAEMAARMDADARRKGRGRKRSEPETIEGEWSEAATA